MADQPTPWRITCELRAKSDVSVNPDRLFHSPAAVVAPNGDWLVCYQDSEDHDGLDGVVSHVRSSDQGQTWTSNGIVFDQRGKQRRCLGRNPTYAVTNGGVIVLVVQRWANSLGTNYVQPSRWPVSPEHRSLICRQTGPVAQSRNRLLTTRIEGVQTRCETMKRRKLLDVQTGWSAGHARYL